MDALRVQMYDSGNNSHTNSMGEALTSIENNERELEKNSIMENNDNTPNSGKILSARSNQSSISNVQGETNSNEGEDSKQSTSITPSNEEPTEKDAEHYDCNLVQGQCFIFTTNTSLDLVPLLMSQLETRIGIPNSRIITLNVTEKPFMLDYMLQLQRRQEGEYLVEQESRLLPQVFFNDFWVGGFQYILDKVNEVAFQWKDSHTLIKRERLGILYQLYREQESIIYLSPSTLAMLKPNPLTQYALGWISYTMVLKQPKYPAALFRIRWTKKNRYSVVPEYGVLTCKNSAAKIMVSVLEKIYDNYESDFFEIDSIAISEDDAKKKWTLETISKVMNKSPYKTMCDLFTTSFVLEERKRSPSM